ncbi:MAG: 50S ribosomal protein L6 [Bacillota bacterium]
MSRVGKKPVTVPSGVTVSVEGNLVRVKGPRGELSREIHDGIAVEVWDGQILVTRASDHKGMRSLHGLTRSLIANMIHGVTQGYQKALELVGVGYRASKSGNKLVLSVGYSKPVEIDPPQGIEIDVPNPTYVIVKGNDKESVGQFAAIIRDVRPPEPYLGKGIRYVGERVRRKVGKTGKK